jgi:hypothetical protein
LPRAVGEFFKETVDTNPAQRAAAIAKQIRDKRPDLFALQEVGILRTHPGTDAKIPATEVVHDQLQLLLKELNRPDQHYDTVAIIPNSEVQVPATLPGQSFVVRITDRTAILARASSNDLKLSNVQIEEYWAKPVLASGLIGMFGWGSVDVDLHDRKFRFVATHLTPAGMIPALIDILPPRSSPACLLPPNADIGPREQSGQQTELHGRDNKKWPHSSGSRARPRLLRALASSPSSGRANVGSCGEPEADRSGRLG